jgi:branched-chain amino acid transport system substrate-binding protein
MTFFGCTRSLQRRIYSPRAGDYSEGGSSLPDYDQVERKPARLVRRLPWETWPLNRDLSGKEISDLTILQGDELLKSGHAAQALEKYRAVAPASLPDHLRGALVMRIASTELALDQPEKALSAMSGYFRELNKIPEDIDVRYSLIFSYSYGRKGDVDQSLAWFSRVNRISGGRGGMGDAASQGVRLLLKSLSNERFEKTASQWNTDSYINGLVGKERLRRAGADYSPEGESSTPNRFWEGEFGPSVPGGMAGSDVTGISANAEPVGVLLPLTGRFGELGQSTRNGIELAFLGQAQSGAVYRPVFRDTQGDEAYASAHLRELLSSGQEVSTVLGPLLSDVSISVGEIARQNRVSTLVFSKRADFPTGNGIFRLAPTVDSQVASLLKSTYRSLGMLKYAIVAPATPAGEEFAESFKRHAAQLNLDIVYETRFYPDDDASLVAIAQEIEKHRVQGVFVPDTIETAVRFSGNLKEAFRERIRLLGTARWYDPAKLANAATILDRAVFVSPFFNKSDRPIVGQFVRAYETRYNAAPNFLAAQGFDAATLIVAALKRQSEEGVDVVRALEDIQAYEGLTGSIRVTGSGEIERDFAVIEMKRGSLNELVGESSQASHLDQGQFQYAEAGSAGRYQGGLFFTRPGVSS